jgi:hypothetical protein
MGKGEQSPGSILDSKAYGFYQQYLLPIEKVVAAVAPGLLAFRTVMLARLINS